MTPPPGEVLQGTLDLIVLKTLDAMGAQHGYGIAVRIQQVSEDLLKLNQGTLYPALLRLEQRGWISSKWGVSENNRKAKFYKLTAAGRRHLASEITRWSRYTNVVADVLAHRRLRIVELGCIVPRKRGAVITVVHVTRRAIGVMTQTEHNCRIGLVVVVIFDLDLNPRIV